ncbi:hypothetical protein LINPERPRIM_LOCUS14446 [Linum perenne]
MREQMATLTEQIINIITMSCIVGGEEKLWIDLYELGIELYVASSSSKEELDEEEPRPANQRDSTDYRVRADIRYFTKQ